MKKLLVYTLLLTNLVAASAQVVGGRHVFEFLSLSLSARTTALGGGLLSVQDDDVALAAVAPSLLNPSMHNALSFNHHFQLGGVQSGSVMYARNAPKLGMMLQFGLQYINYGTFDAADEYGAQIGSFKAADYAFLLGGMKKLDEHFSIGLNLKFVSSQLESYRSTGLAADVSGTYHDPEAQICATLAVRNLGVQLSTYSQQNQREPLPLDIQLGLSKRLKHTPLRFSVLAHHLQRWNIRYQDPATVAATTFLNDTQSSSSSSSIWIDNLFRHLTFGAEVLVGKKENLRFRIGYNHLRRQELSVENYRSFAGFSLGAGIKVSNFRLDYGRAFTHLAGSTNHLTVSTNLEAFGLK